MELVNASSSLTVITEDLISEKTVLISAVIIRVCVNSALAFCALITNTINVIVFRKMGIDHSTESFLILSIADGLVGLVGTFAGVCNGLRYMASPQLASSMYPMYILLLAAATVPSLTSLVSTTIIAVVRCCCVTLPLHVRTVFTARRQRFSIIFCTVVSLAFLSYGLSGTELRVGVHPNTNYSQLMITFHPEYIERNRFADFYRGIMFYVCFSTVLICLVCLVIALKRSSKFRSNSWNTESTRGSQNKENSHRNSQLSKGGRRFKLGSKETQVVKVVVLVSAVFTVSNLPAMVASILRQAVPEFNNIGKFQRSFDFTMILVECFLLANTTINILIYLKFNSRYYTSFLEVIGRKK